MSCPESGACNMLQLLMMMMLHEIVSYRLLLLKLLLQKNMNGQIRCMFDQMRSFSEEKNCLLPDSAPRFLQSLIYGSKMTGRENRI